MKSHDALKAAQILKEFKFDAGQMAYWIKSVNDIESIYNSIKTSGYCEIYAIPKFLKPGTYDASKSQYCEQCPFKGIYSDHQESSIYCIISKFRNVIYNQECIEGDMLKNEIFEKTKLIYEFLLELNHATNK